MRALAILLSLWLFVPQPAGQVVTVEIRAEHGAIGDVLAIEGDGPGETPTCSVGRPARTCRVTAGPLTAISITWAPEVARCGRQPRLVATVGAAVVVEEVVPLPAGMRCAYLPAVGVP